MKYKKSDVDFHSDYGRQGNPAVNVKYYGRGVTPDQIESHFLCSEKTAEAVADWVWEAACQEVWDGVSRTA